LLFMTATSSASIIALRGWRDFRRDGTAQCAQFTVAPPQHFLYFFPEPHGHGSFRLTLEVVRRDSGAKALPAVGLWCPRKYRYAPTSPAAMCTMMSSRFSGVIGFGRILGSSSCSW